MLKHVLRHKNYQHICYCTKASPKTNPYSHTVLLPKTKIPLRIEGNKLVERDKNVYKLGAFDKFYEWQESHLEGPEYILHDGPPYANGKPHMGHAINKILKDVILRNKIIDGRRVNYIPGWDCHGLPIELKALSDSTNLDVLELRKKAKDFAQNTIENQMKVFKSWGVIGDWNNHYETKNIDYVENEIRQFYEIYQKGYIYRDVKPIYWSPSSRTALAEAELEYSEKHRSPSAYFRFKIKDISNVPSLHDKRVYAVVWTTTPWTLPSNQAVCYNNSLSYCLVKKPDPDDTDLYVVAVDLFESFCKATNINFELLGVHSGDMLHEATYLHPIYLDKVCKFLHSSHATNLKGTGLVHTAPAHGPDDFLVAIRTKMPVVDLVNEEGRYKPEAGEKFANKFVLTEGNEAVLQLLKNDLLHLSEIVHSYPYDWRTKKPVIVRASKQWFIDTEKIKSRAVEVLENVQIIPKERSSIYKNRLVSQLLSRPYWCISRQRKWGVPIPVFYDRETGEVLLNQDIIEHICTVLNKNGTDFWWKLSTKDLLPSSYENNVNNLKKGEDILDIWFDSGISWSKVLKQNQIADLYLEGVDQFNGWFQSSLVTSVVLKDQAPYKAIYVHGFAVDKDGVKMSKSLGNAVDPVEVVCGTKKRKAYGVDTLRWWVACHANQVALAAVSDNVLDQSKDEVQKIRSVLRFALAAIFDYQYDPKDIESLLTIDRYILHLLLGTYQKCKLDLQNFDFHKINTQLIPLLTNQISALYFTSIKDRLYCEPEKSVQRRSAQYTLLHLFYAVAELVGGILPHLVEELYAELPQKSEGTFFTGERLSPCENWMNAKCEEVMNLVLEVKKMVHKMAEGENLVNFEAEISFGQREFQFLTGFKNKAHLENELKDILQVSHVEIIQGETKNEQFEVKLIKSAKHSCPRCRLVRTVIKDDLCDRCKNVVCSFEENKTAVAS